MLTPRTYQRQTNNLIVKYMRESGGKPGNPLVIWPTGTGKAFGIALKIRTLLTMFPSIRIMMATHSEELVSQNYDELKELWPEAPVGIYCASLGRYDTSEPIIFGSIDSIAGNLEKFGKFNLMSVDEAHRIPPKDESRYRATYHHFKKLDKHFFVIGWTATAYRQGQGELTDEGGLFTEVLYDATTLEAYNWFFEQGFLIPPIAAPTRAQVSSEKMGMMAGDFKQSDLQASFEREREGGAIEAALRESVAVAAEEGRKTWMVFVPGIAACDEVAEMLDSMGITSTIIHSKIPRKERRKRLEDYKAGQYTAVISNGVLTTGFNHKPVDFIIMLRKTASAALWVQMLGRGTRPWYAAGFDITTLDGRWQAIRENGKLNFRVMDFVGNTARLGPINDPVKPKKPGEKKAGVAPIKICDSCSAYNHASLRSCFYCGFEFPKTEFIEAASTIPIVKNTKADDKPITEWFDVDKVTYRPNYKTRKPTLVVTYFYGKSKIEEFICLEHDGPAKARAKRWWRERSGEMEVPATIMDCLPDLEKLKVPRRILIWTNGKPKEIKNYEY